MKILYVFRALAIWGGIERILVDKMNYLSDVYGFEVFILTANQGKHPVPYALSDSVHMEDLNIRFHDQYKYKGLRRLYDRINRNRMFEKRLSSRISQISPDIIVCVADGYQISIAKVKGNIPLVVESHNNCSYLYQGQTLFQKFDLWQQRKALSKVKVLVTLTTKDALEWGKMLPHVVVIPNFTNINTSGSVSNHRNKRVIFVGRFEAQKRVTELLNIWKIIYPDFPDWRLDISLHDALPIFLMDHLLLFLMEKMAFL